MKESLDIYVLEAILLRILAGVQAHICFLVMLARAKQVIHMTVKKKTFTFSGESDLYVYDLRYSYKGLVLSGEYFSRTETGDLNYCCDERMLLGAKLLKKKLSATE